MSRTNRGKGNGTARSIVIGFVVLTFSLPLFMSTAVQAQKKNGGPTSTVSKFRKGDRQRLIAAILQGQHEITLLIASKSGKNDLVVNQLIDLGASIRLRSDAVDYLRIKVAPERVHEIVCLDDVEAVAVDGVQMYYTPQESALNTPVNDSQPNATTSDENPFLPTRDIGAPQFIRDHPTFDGRGVTIANLDGNTPDVLAIPLQEALALDGSKVSKVSEVLNALDPVDDQSSIRIDMSNQIEVSKGQFEWKGTSYSCPSDGTYRVGFFDIAKFGRGLLLKYLPEKVSTAPGLAILWDEKNDRVWVDTNLNKSFLDETQLSDFNSSHQPGIFGKDDISTPRRETVAFAVLINHEHKLLYLAPFVGGHSTSTASVAAGRGFFGGRMNGVAPSAQILSIWQDSLTHVMVEATIFAVQNAKVDLVSMQWGAFIPPRDGNSVVGIVFERLIEKYQKPIFASADNLGPGLSTNDEPPSSNGVLSIGGYVRNDTWLSNYGVSTPVREGLVNLSSRGPRVDGGFKPDLVAPAVSVTASFGDVQPRPGMPFNPSSGYAIGTGTSLSCPMVSGAAALLISAAKQMRIPYDAGRIAWALKSSARYLQDVGAHEQGSGLVDVAAAWEALKRAPIPVTIRSWTDIRVSVGPYLRTPDRGPGIFEHEGWQTGQSGKRAITFMRTTGSEKPITYQLRWTGNDGTFLSQPTLILPLNIPVLVPVRIKVTTTGIHSAILDLDDQRGARSIYQVMNTVVSAEQFTAADDFTLEREGAAPFPGYTSYFLNVPKDASGFQVMALIHKGRLRMRLMRPSGKEFDFPYDTPVRWPPEYQVGGILDRFISYPEPGVWQIVIENQDLHQVTERSAALRAASFHITARVFKVTASPMIKRHRSNVDTAKETIRFINQYAPSIGYRDDSNLASVFSTQVKLKAADGPLVHDVNLPAGVDSLEVKIDGSAANRSDIDIYVYACEPTCELKAYGSGIGVNKRVTISNPKAGKWKVVLDPTSLRSDIRLRYSDFFTHSNIQSLAFSKLNSSFESGFIPLRKIGNGVSNSSAVNRRIMGIVRLMHRDPVTTGYEYNESTKRIEPVKEYVRFGEAFIKVPPRATRESFPTRH